VKSSLLIQQLVPAYRHTQFKAASGLFVGTFLFQFTK